MTSSSFTPLPAGGPRGADFFERRSRKSGGSSRSYSEQFSGPAHVRAEKKTFWQLLLLVAVLPPVGVALMWRFGILRVRPRVAVTVFAFAVMVLYMYWIIPTPKPEVYRPTVVRPAAVTEYSPSVAPGDGAN